MESLLRSFKKGDEKAFDEVFRQYFSSLSLFAFKLVGDEQEAEDIVQDCFVSLWNRRKSLSHVDSIRAYLYTTVRNRCLDVIRSGKEHRKIIEIGTKELANDEPDIEALMTMSETVREILNLIELLPPRMQQVFKLYYIEGKSYQEIGKLLDTDPETVRNQRFKALQLIRKTFIPG
jgi:RNA polymerase sigma-70 factor (ECF subfamily)